MIIRTIKKVNDEQVFELMQNKTYKEVAKMLNITLSQVKYIRKKYRFQKLKKAD